MTAYHFKQTGSALIITLLLTSFLLLVALGCASNTNQQTRLIYNYQQHLESLIKAQACVRQIQKTFSNLSSPKNWGSNGLYQSDIKGPINFRIFKWTANSNIVLNKNCRYVIEYLGEIILVNSNSKQVLLRLTVKGVVQDYYTRTIQLNYLFEQVQENKITTEIKFTSKPKLQQWTEL